MDEKLIAQNIKEEIFRKEFERYFHILEEGLNKEPYKNLYWQKAQALYNSILNGRKPDKYNGVEQINKNIKHT